MTDYRLAAHIIGGFEGYIPSAEWDVNSWRLGYGSDTEGPEQRRVSKGMSTTRERALDNLALRIPAFEKTIVGAIGGAAWARLSEPAKAALASFAYNYGALTPTLARLVAGRDDRAAAREIHARGVDNHGVNAHRRDAEARLFAGGQGVPLAIN